MDDERLVFVQEKIDELKVDIDEKINELSGITDGSFEKITRKIDMDFHNDFEERLEGIKLEVEMLKKIKKQRKKLEKLEEEKDKVLMEIERRYERKRRSSKHKDGKKKKR